MRVRNLPFLLLLLVFCLFVFYTYPFPAIFWSMFHRNEIIHLNKFTSTVNGDRIFNGFLNSEVGPSKINLYYVGTTSFTKEEFVSRLKMLAPASISELHALREGLNSIMDYDIGCSTPKSGVITLGRQYPDAYKFLFKDEKGRNVTVFYFPLGSDDVVFCNNKQIKSNIFEVYIETLKRSPF